MASKVLDVSWDSYYEIAGRLAITIKESGWEFDRIVCIARGAMFVGDMFSREKMFNRPLGVIYTKSYHGTEQGNLDISKIAFVGDFGNKVLLLDDLVDSGVTMREVKKHIESEFPGVEVKTAVLWKKTCSQFEPDYFADSVEKGIWIKQPFEKFDEVSIEGF